MREALRVLIWSSWLGVLSACQYGNLDEPPADSQPSASPAYQVYLRPRIDPATFRLVDHAIVIRDRLTGEERVVDTVQPGGAGSSTITSRTLTFGRFSSTLSSGPLSAGQARITEAQNRRLLYLTGGTRETGGHLQELRLDQREAPIRRLSTEDNICNIAEQVLYDFSDIEQTSILYQLPGFVMRDGQAVQGDCTDTNERPIRQIRLSFDEKQPSILLGSSFRPIGRPLNPDGSARRRLVDIEFDDDVAQSDFVGCPFFLRDRNECLAIRRFDNLDGCRRRDQCVDCRANPLAPCGASMGVIRELGGSGAPFADQSVRTQAGPSYRLSNQFFRVGRLEVRNHPTFGLHMVPTHGDLVLYLDNRDDVSQSKFQVLHSFTTPFRRSGFKNLEGGLPEIVVSASPDLVANMVVQESIEAGEPDLVFFSDGAELFRARINPDDATDFVVEKVFPAPGQPPPGGEILDVRTLGGEVVFRWCGPLVPPTCQDGDAICALQRNSCPNGTNVDGGAVNFSNERRQVLYAIPSGGGTVRSVDEIEGGNLTVEVLTSTAWTYTKELHRAADGTRLDANLVQRQARILALDAGSAVVGRRALAPLPGFETEPYDGSGWVRDLQLGDESTPTNAARSVVRAKLKGDDEIDVVTTQSFVLAFRNRPNGDTDLFALDLSDLRSDTATLLGTVPSRQDLRDHPDCVANNLPSGVNLPGATAGAVFGYGRQALIQLTTPRSAAIETETDTINAVIDTDIYAADLGTPGSLVPVSLTAPPATFGKRVFCPGDPANPAVPPAANDQLINR